MRLWDKFCVPRLCWRRDETISRTIFGAHFFVRPVQFVENRICFFGEWEPSITAVFRKLLRPGDRVIDVGANIGYFTILSSMLVGETGRVFAFEPSVETRSRLHRNLELNGIQNVSVIPSAAWNETGTATFNKHPSDRGGSSLRSIEGSIETETVDLVPIESAIDEAEWSKIRLVKIDIEGAECHGVEGMARLLESNRDVVVITEMEDPKLQRFGRSAADLLASFDQRGFFAFRIPNSYDALEYIRPCRTVKLSRISEAPRESSYIAFSRNRDFAELLNDG